MTKELLDQILAVLLPEMDDANARKTLIESALYGSPVLDNIEWTGAARPFTIHVLRKLDSFGTLSSGKPALVALLEETRQQVGKNHQEKIDRLLQELSHPTNRQPDALTQYRLDRIEEWSQARYELDKRFVNLTLLLDKGEHETQRWQTAESWRFNDLRDVLAKTEAYPALVLLGAPGSGKSTLLRRLQFDHSLERLREDDQQLTFFVPLNSYRADTKGVLLEPREWLNTRWQESYPQLESLDTYMQAGRVILLLDALNEMPHKSTADYFDLVGLWREFVQAATKQRNRIVFTCRSLDYSASLSSEALRVPQVEVQPMTPEQVKDFLAKYTPDYADQVWEQLDGTPQFGLFQTPYFLSLLCAQVKATNGSVPQGRAELFTGFVRQAIKRECERNKLFRPDTLLSERDHRQLANNDWSTPFDLPRRGVLIPKLNALAFGMQVKGLETESAQVRIAYDDACGLLTHDRAADLVKAGVALNVLDEDSARDEVLFFHQLLQEYFAARQLAAEPNPALVQVEWAADKVSESLEKTIAALADGDPLPPLPQTGWEETTLTAAPMAGNAEAFIQAVSTVNLPLAARCAAAAEVRVSDQLKAELQQQLIARSQDQQADLRARIAAGEALGLLGDPRFELRTGPHGEYLLPPVVTIPGGTYPIGDDQGNYEDEKPAHTVTLAPFEIGQFPVTNAEYAKFLAAGGYEDEQWWDTAEARMWLRGEGSTEGSKQQWRDNRKTSQTNWSEDEIRAQKNWAPDTKDLYLEIRSMTDEDYELRLEEWFPAGKLYRQPEFWNDTGFSNPAQPVVGVTWFEARAYCNWLTANVSNDHLYRLPTEVEFEAAARGQEGRLFPYGNSFDASKCNTFESHLRRPTPVGIFANATPEGAFDLSGNAYTRTLSIYDQEQFPYPYRSDGREDIHQTDVRRVLRGGSWFSYVDLARAVSRDFNQPAGRDFNDGFRVVREWRPPFFLNSSHALSHRIKRESPPFIRASRLSASLVGRRFRKRRCYG